MQTVGIICEYNPFHNGHLYQIRRTRELVGEDCAVVCAMSGNFVQRGEFAVFSKFARAKAAVMEGADLVIELPVTAAVSSAEGFAMGAVKLLNSLGVCTHISFGSEAGDLAPLMAATDALLSLEIDGEIKCALNTGISYAAARQTALRKLIGSAGEVLSQPNNILAVEYLKALKKTGSDMTPITVGRFGGEHDENKGNSASAVRKLLFSGQYPWENVPEKAAGVFKSEIEAGRGPVTIKSVEPAVLYRLRTMTEDEFNALPYSGEGLGMRLMKAVKSGTGIEDVLEKTKTKRYAMSRIRRMVLCAYLGITAEDMGHDIHYVRVLAAGVRGQAILREMRKKCALPCVIKPAQGLALDGEAGRIFARETAMNDLYSLAFEDKSQRVCGFDLTASPYMEK